MVSYEHLLYGYRSTPKDWILVDYLLKKVDQELSKAPGEEDRAILNAFRTELVKIRAEDIQLADLKKEKDQAEKSAEWCRKRVADNDANPPPQGVPQECLNAIELHQRAKDIAEANLSGAKKRYQIKFAGVRIKPNNQTPRVAFRQVFDQAKQVAKQTLQETTPQRSEHVGSAPAAKSLPIKQLKPGKENKPNEPKTRQD